MKEIVAYKKCFVCGRDNESGLKAVFYFDGEKALSEITAGEAFEGYRGIYHGGIISTMLDEVMLKAILAIDRIAVTAELTIKYHKPVRTGDRLMFSGQITQSRGKLLLTEGFVAGDDGSLFASATGKYIEVKEHLRDELLTSLE